MIKLLKKLLGMCDHTWETVATHKTEYNTWTSSGHGHMYVLQCKKCGNVKNKHIRL